MGDIIVTRVLSTCARKLFCVDALGIGSVTSAVHCTK